MSKKPDKKREQKRREEDKKPYVCLCKNDIWTLHMGIIKCTKCNTEYSLGIGSARRFDEVKVFTRV